MKALTYSAYGPLGNLALTNVSAPEPRPGEVVVDVLRAALNPKDSLFRKGRFRPLSGWKFPKRCGLDYAGVVRVSRSARFTLGQRVFGALDEWTFARGTIAEQVCVTENEIAETPDGVTDDAASAIGLAGLTSLQAFRNIARVRPGARIWIHGASGGVGTVAIQVARALDAQVTTTSSEANMPLCTELGASRALAYTDLNACLTELRGEIDVVFDVFGNLSASRVATVFGDAGVFVSTVPSAKRAMLDVATRWSRLQQRLVVVSPNAADLQQLGSWLESGILRATIDSRFPIDRASEGFRVLESKHARGKIIVEVA